MRQHLVFFHEVVIEDHLPRHEVIASRLCFQDAQAWHHAFRHVMHEDA
jgi:hypothetical protein